MFNITNAVQLLLDAEKVNASQLLTDDERYALLCAIRDAVPEGLPGIPQASLTVRAAISRLIDTNGTRAKAPTKQGRKAKGNNGDQAPPEVDAGRTEEGPEAPEGETARSSETSDAGSPDSVPAGTPEATTEA